MVRDTGYSGDGTLCASEKSGSSGPNLITIAAIVLVIFFVLLVGCLCFLQYLHRKRKRRPMLPFGNATLSQVCLKSYIHELCLC